MAGLQRSAVSFRRQGSSGLVWDDRFLSGELNKVNQKDEDNPDQEQGKDGHQTVGSISSTIQSSRSNAAYRTGKVSPAIEPPSPKLSACGFCSAFGKTGDKGQRRRQPAKRR